MMRRSDRAVTAPQEIRDILDRCKVCRLAMADAAGLYIVPMNFGYTLEEGRLTLYFHSAREGRKIDAITAAPQVAFEMDGGHALTAGDAPCDYSYRYESITGTGRAAFCRTAEEKAAGLRAIFLHQTGQDFAFTAFPRVELACGNHAAGFFVTTQLIIKRDAFDRQVVALLHLLQVFFEESKTILIGVTELFVELVELHKDTCIGGVERISLFEQNAGTLLVVALIVISQGQVTPYGGEGIVDAGRKLPALDSLVIATCSIPEVTQRIGSLRAVSGIETDGILQDVYLLDAVGEAIAVVAGISLAIILQCLRFIAFERVEITYGISNDGINVGSVLHIIAQQGYRLIITAGRSKVEGILYISVCPAAHHGAQLVHVGSIPADKIFFIPATHIETVYGQ